MSKLSQYINLSHSKLHSSQAWWTVKLYLITHESEPGMSQTSFRFKSVLAVRFAFTVGLVCNKNGRIQQTGFRFPVIEQGLNI